MNQQNKIILNTCIILIFIGAWWLGQTLMAMEKGKAGDIFINQLGYLPDLPKRVVSLRRAAQFLVVETKSSHVVFKGKLLACQDPTSQRTVWRGDFSQFDNPGNYRIELPGIGHSDPFAIKADLYNNLLQQSLHSYYLQRCGTAVNDPATGLQHPICHEDDGYVARQDGFYGSGQAINCRGGWHDAGDYGKYVPTTAVTVAQLLSAFELWPEKFSDGQLQIPESGNGIPDILDEVRVGLEWLFTMQRPDGAVYHKLAGNFWAGFENPDGDRQKRYIYGIATADTAKLAAVMAIAARVFGEWDPELAGRARQAALKAWHFLNSHPYIWDHDKTDDLGSGAYSAIDDRADRLWAALELGTLPGKIESASQLAPSMTPSLMQSLTHYSPEAVGWSDASLLGFFDYARSPDADAKLKSITVAKLISLAEIYRKAAATSGFGYSLSYPEFFWASNKDGLARGIVMLLADYFRPDISYRQGALAQLDFILGLNPLSKCYVSGFGASPVVNLHHRWCVAAGKPIPGLLAGGPNNRAESGIEPAGKGPYSYADENGSYSSNEPAIDYNAALVFVTAAFATR